MKPFATVFAASWTKKLPPFHAEWEEQGYVGREVCKRAGERGFLSMSMPEAFGGPAAGSDLQGIQSTAIQQPDGSFLLNGSQRDHERRDHPVYGAGG